MFTRRATHLFRTFNSLISQSPRLFDPAQAPARLLSQVRMSSAIAKRIEGKTIVITGASSGIGKSIAFEFARTASKDLRLILTARRVNTLKQIAEDIVKEVGEGVKVLPVQLDVSKPEEVRNFVPNLPKEWQDIHVLVNNA